MPHNESTLQLDIEDHRFHPMIQVLDHCQLCVRSGQIVAILGPSGCGKSTLLRIAGGLIDASKGIVRNNFDRQSFLFQQDRLLPWKTALDNVRLGLLTDKTDQAASKALAAQALEQVGLLPRHFLQNPAELSGGMRQRVALARAFVCQPSLLLMDEPFSALDFFTRSTLQQLLLRQVLERQCSAVVVTHDVREALLLADELVFMSSEPGQTVMRQPLSRTQMQRDASWLASQERELLQNPAVKACFEPTERQWTSP